MVNQGRRGSRAENQVADELGAMGYDVVRSAASKGAADLVAVHDGEILFVQVKLLAPGKTYTQPSPAERRELVRIARRANGFPVVAIRVPGAGSRPARTDWNLLTGTGPEDRQSWIPNDSRTDGPVVSEPMPRLGTEADPRGRERPLRAVQ